MKIQCNACGAAEARVLCCADEAALCVACDEEVHAANKLAGKHQRVPLLTDADADAAAAAAPAVPNCDICQVEEIGNLQDERQDRYTMHARAQAQAQAHVSVASVSRTCLLAQVHEKMQLHAHGHL